MNSAVGPPIHKPEAARAYLLRSIAFADSASKEEGMVKEEQNLTPSKNKKASASTKAVQREHAVAILLKAIDHVCASWASTLTADELDRRASVWYAKTRPDVQDGQAGWGQRGIVPLRAIVDLAKD